MNLKQFKKEIEILEQEAWDKMGFPGNDNYMEKATPDELHYFGRFRALEDVLDLLERMQ